MNTKKEIIDFLKSNQSAMQEEYHLTKVGLFGSFARDEQSNDSDVDVLVEIENGTENIYDLKQSLSRYLSQAFGRKVDIAREKYLKPFAKEMILKDAIFVY